MTLAKYDSASSTCPAAAFIMKFRSVMKMFHSLTAIVIVFAANYIHVSDAMPTPIEGAHFQPRPSDFGTWVGVDNENQPIEFTLERPSKIPRHEDLPFDKMKVAEWEKQNHGKDIYQITVKDNGKIRFQAYLAPFMNVLFDDGLISDVEDQLQRLPTNIDELDEADEDDEENMMSVITKNSNIVLTKKSEAKSEAKPKQEKKESSRRATANRRQTTGKKEREKQ